VKYSYIITTIRANKKSTLVLDNLHTAAHKLTYLLTKYRHRQRAISLISVFGSSNPPCVSSGELLVVTECGHTDWCDRSPSWHWRPAMRHGPLVAHNPPSVCLYVDHVLRRPGSQVSWRSCTVCLVSNSAVRDT